MEEKIKGFVVYPTYRVIDSEGKKKALLYLFGRLENNESFLVIKHYRPYFYIKSDDLEKAKNLLRMYNSEIESTSYKNFSDELVSKVIIDLPGDVAKLRKDLENLNIDCYEADIRFYQRCLIDSGIKGTLQIKGDFKAGKYVNRIYEEPEISGIDYRPKLKTLAIDIETDSKAKKIFCVSLYSKSENSYESNNVSEIFKKVIIVSLDKDIGKPLTDTISVNSEKELIEKFQELVLKIDPDIITGWNLIDFDLKILKQKFDEYKIPFTLGRIDWPCKLDINTDFMKDSQADFPGRMVLDGITLLKTSFIKLENYKLETAAEEFLGEKKLITSENKGDDIENYYYNNQQKLVDYNLKDSEMTYNILEKTNAIQLTILRALITGMTLDRVKASVASLDSLFLRYAKKRGIVLSSSRFSDKDEPGKGGFVMKSKPGLYNYVIVCDFKSLYPSIIRTFNIDPYSYIEKKDREKILLEENSPKFKEQFIKLSNGAIFKNQEGILPKLIEEVWIQRDEAKKRKDTPETIYAIKIIMNSFYGVLGNPSCRFFNPEISNAITYTGESIIKLTTTKVEELGYEVIYGDTDSIFVVTGSDNESEASKIGIKIQNYINEFYKEYIRKEFNRESVLELQYEKLFKIFLLPKVRGSEDVGAKKRYAGLLIKNDKEEMSFTGMEFVRGDWTDLAKKFQLELFELLFNNKEIDSYIKNFVISLKKGEFDDLLVYKKNINKPLNEYTKTTPPHVKAARQLKKLTSNQIQYIMTLEGPEALEVIKNKPDYEHYIEKQLKPIADTILSVYGRNFEDIINNSKQSTLFGY